MAEGLQTIETSQQQIRYAANGRDTRIHTVSDKAPLALGEKGRG